MYYKVIKDNKVIDVLDNLIYLKYQKKHNRMLLSDEQHAQAVLSSDEEHFWHTVELEPIPVKEYNGYDSVEIIEIDEYEYKKLKCLNGKSPEEIIDEYTMNLIEEGIL